VLSCVVDRVEFMVAVDSKLAITDSRRAAAKMEKLIAFLTDRGGHEALVSGWCCFEEVRLVGHTAGTSDWYFVPPRGASTAKWRFRSNAEVARHFGLLEDDLRCRRGAGESGSARPCHALTLHSGAAREAEAVSEVASRPRRRAAIAAVEKADRCRQIERAAIDERPGMPQPAAPRMGPFSVGHRVLARYQATTFGKQARFYPGVVRAVAPAADSDHVRYDIQYDDGDYEASVPDDFVRDGATEVSGKRGRSDGIALIEYHESPEAKRAALMDLAADG